MIGSDRMVVQNGKIVFPFAVNTMSSSLASDTKLWTLSQV